MSFDSSYARDEGTGGKSDGETASMPGKRSQTDRLSAPEGAVAAGHAASGTSSVLTGTAWLDGVLGFATGTSGHDAACPCGACVAGRVELAKGEGDDDKPLNEVKKEGADAGADAGTPTPTTPAPTSATPAQPQPGTQTPAPSAQQAQQAPSAQQAQQAPGAPGAQQDPKTGNPQGQSGGSTATPPTITSRTAKTAPGGAAATRTTIGVGEVVEFTGSVAGTWTADAGTPPSGASGTTFRWTAPNAPASVTVTLTVGSQTATKTMTVIAPSSLSMVVASNHALTAGVAGVCMVTNVTVGPSHVSFGNVEWLEVPGPGSNITGYFTKFSASTLYHNPNPSWLKWNDSNTGLSDHAAWHAVTGPYSVGTFDWDVPNKYRVAGSGGTGTVFTTTHQLFRMTDATGTMSVSKAGASATRAP